MSVHNSIPKGNCIESPAIRYLYYVITNTLQACGEVTKVNEENMILLAKAAYPNSNMTPNLGAMLLLHLSRQANQTRGGVITVLANALGINLGNLRPLISGNAKIFIRIPGVGHLLPTPMLNQFSIKDEILHYNAQGEDEEEDPEAAMPDDVEEEAGEPEAEVKPEDNEEGDGSYVTYTDVRGLGDSINDMSDLANSLRDTTEAMMSHFTTWSHGWAPGYYQPSPQ